MPRAAAPPPPPRPAFAAKLAPRLHRTIAARCRDPATLPAGGVLVPGAAACAPQIAEAPDRPREVHCEYAAEGCDEPWLMLPRGSRKMIPSETHGPQFFDLAADPHELRDLAGLPEHAAAVAAMIAAIRAHWDVPAPHSAVLASQSRRHALRAALAEGDGGRPGTGSR